MSKDLLDARASYLDARETERATALQTAALFLTAGLDLDAVIDASAEEKHRLVLRLERLVERERLRGVARHWTYDLNRHIALTQVLTRLRTGATPATLPPKPSTSAARFRLTRRKRKGTPAMPRPLENR